MVFALGYFGFGTVLGLADWKVNGLLLIFFGFSLVLFGVNVLLIKDILPVGEYTRPDSLGAVIRMVSLAATSAVLVAFGGALIAGGGMVLLQNA